MSINSQSSIQRSLLSKNLVFAVAVLLFGSALVFGFSLILLIQLNITRMAAHANFSLNEVNQFQIDLEQELFRYQDDEDLNGRDKTTTARTLGRLYRTAKHFQRVLLVSEEEIVYAYPPEELRTTLSTKEKTVTAFALESGERQRVVSQIDRNGQVVSFIYPVLFENSTSQTLLVGRVPLVDLAGIIDYKNEHPIRTYLVNGENQVIVQTGGGPAVSTWSDKLWQSAREFDPALNGDGRAFLDQVTFPNWELIYSSPNNARAWNIGVTMPFLPIFNQALLIAFTFAAAVTLLGTVSFVQLRHYSKGLTQPLKQLTKESRSIAGGGSLTNRIYTNRKDEVGELANAFSSMQLALKGRLDELSLLLEVTQDISSSINIKQSMPIILQGALRGTGASGARVLILDPTGRVPLSFSEGPTGSDLSIFDRSLMVLLREQKELALETVKDVKKHAELSEGESIPFKSLYALPLKTTKFFQGVIFLGYRQERSFSKSERQLLRTLAGQAAVLVENAYLFATAEGGRRRLAAVLASTSEAIIVTDPTDRVLDINRAMEEAFHISTSSVRGRALADVIGSADLVHAMKRSKTGKLDLEIVGENERSYFVNISPIVNQSGLVIGKVAILTDITHYKEIDRLKSDFVNNVSHDLRTPLTLIHGYLSTLSMTEDISSEQRAYIGKIAGSVDHMTNMVETLLDLSRIEAGVDLMFEPVDIGILLRELVDEHWFYSQEAGIELVVNVSKELPTIIADKSLVNQAISNFLTNGYKYAPNSGKMIITAKQVGNEIVISVRDQGPGISRQDQLRLFEKFYRVPRQGKEKVDGTGLGLGLVKSIAEQHSGRTWVQSEWGRGSTFYFSIPIAENRTQIS